MHNEPISPLNVEFSPRNIDTLENSFPDRDEPASMFPGLTQDNLLRTLENFDSSKQEIERMISTIDGMMVESYRPLQKVSQHSL